MYRIDNWINEESGRIIESMNGAYVNITMYSPLIGSSFAELPNKLKNPKKGLINIKNNGNKCFLWCNVRHLHLIIIWLKPANNLIYEEIEFPISKKDYCKIKKQNNICINVFFYENRIIYPPTYLAKKF